MNLPTRISLLLVVAACSLTAASTASAQVQPAGTGEPLYTNSTQNTQWFEWPATSGIDGYRAQFSYYANGTLKADPTYDAPNGATNYWANWAGVSSLAHGSQYGICAQGRYSLPQDSLFYPDGPNSCSMGTILGRRSHTTIDRSKPSAALTVADGAAFSKSTAIKVRTDFSDDVAGPFPANFLCFQYGGETNICDAGAGFIYGYNAACSVPAGGGKSTSFTCTADFGAGVPDGPLWACVRAADAAIPDNPNGPNQGSTADKANLSDPSCDKVVLDRQAPSASILASGTSVKVGDLVSFEAQAADATSGLAGYRWSWGDHTAEATGGSANHTFTQAGTYEVTLSVADAAGNTGTAKKVITVTAPATGGSSTGGSTGGGSTGGGSTGGGSTTTGGGTTSGGGTTTSGGGSTSGGGAAVTQVVTQAGGTGGTQTRTVGGSLQVLAPRKVALGKVKALPLALTAEQGGQASVALVRGGRVVARGSKRLTGAGTVAIKVKLPKGAKAGAYVLKVTFKPSGAKATTSTLKVKLTGAAKARASARLATASAHRGGVSSEGAPEGLPDGRFKGDRPAKRFTARAVAAR